MDPLVLRKLGPSQGSTLVYYSRTFEAHTLAIAALIWLLGNRRPSRNEDPLMAMAGGE